MIYIVQPGDTIFSIAAAWNVSPDRLRYDNQLSLTDTLVVGQALLILLPETLHQVEPGDTAIGIARQYGITLRELLQRNPFLTENMSDSTAGSLFPENIPLTSGQYLVIRYADQSDAPAILDGYAYPFIRRNLLAETLPFLHSLYVFSYGFTAEGQLIEPPGAEFLVRQARRFGVGPVLVLTPMSESETFNSNLITVLTGSAGLQDTLIGELMDTAERMGYVGIDVDFEFIPAESRDDYTTFIARLTEQAHQNGLTVSVALAPKISASQPGILYQGIDYGGLGSVADQVLLMTYEWGYTYGPPMAVAPLPNVRRVVEYALTEIPAGKILLGLPNYGYDWPLPFIRGTTAAVTVGNAQAVEIARTNGVEIQFDSTAMAPWFNYRRANVAHVVWFEDVRSMTAKFGLIKEYGLKGGGYWNLMREFRANWGLAGISFQLG